MSNRSEIMSHGMEPLADDAYQISKHCDKQLLRKVLRKIPNIPIYSNGEEISKSVNRK